MAHAAFVATLGKAPLWQGYLEEVADGLAERAAAPGVPELVAVGAA